jgi:hypothetical protein
MKFLSLCGLTTIIFITFALPSKAQCGPNGCAPGTSCGPNGCCGPFGCSPTCNPWALQSNPWAFQPNPWWGYGRPWGWNRPWGYGFRPGVSVQAPFANINVPPRWGYFRAD